MEGSLEGTSAEESHEARSSLRPGHPFYLHAAPGLPTSSTQGIKEGPDKGRAGQRRAGLT